MVSPRALARCVARRPPTALGRRAPRRRSSRHRDERRAGRRRAAQPIGGWADSVLATLSLRDKAAQMVWPWVLGDYTAADDPTYRRVERLVREQHVGGFIMSVGSPDRDRQQAERAAAAQPAAAARRRGSRDRRRRSARAAATSCRTRSTSAARRASRTQMAIGATRDTTLAYADGARHRARGTRARHPHGVRAGARRQQQPGESGHQPAVVRREPAARRRAGRRASCAAFRRTGCSPRGSISPDTATRSRTRISSSLASTPPRARLDSVELVPFRAAIQAGVRGIMTFHGQLPGARYLVAAGDAESAHHDRPAARTARLPAASSSPMRWT